jgi:hypothetical protein
MDVPRLIETRARDCIAYSLRRAHEIRVTAYYYILNAAVALLFFCIFGAVLYACYRRQPSEEERRRKMLHDQSVVLSKIRAYQQFSRADEDRITGLARPDDA